MDFKNNLISINASWHCFSLHAKAFAYDEYGNGFLTMNRSVVNLEVLEPQFRPVAASADSAEHRHIKTISIAQAQDITLRLLYDQGYSLADRAIAEQFRT